MALYGGAVPGDLLDLILIALAAAFAVAGYRQGFIVGVLSFVGFLGGAAVGAVFSPAIARALVSGPARLSAPIAVSAPRARPSRGVAETVGASTDEILAELAPDAWRARRAKMPLPRSGEGDT